MEMNPTEIWREMKRYDLFNNNFKLKIKNWKERKTKI